MTRGLVTIALMTASSYALPLLGSAWPNVRDSGQADLRRIQASNGRWLAFTYAPSSNRITQIQDNLGRTWTYAYDGGNRLQTVTDPEGGVTTYTYDLNNRMSTLTDASTIVFFTNHYDANGRVSSQTQADATTYQFAYTLDGQGNVTQTDVTDPRGSCAAPRSTRRGTR